MVEFKDILSRPVNIFSDSFIQSLYEMKPLDRNIYFVSLFKNLKFNEKYETNWCPQIGKSDFENPKGWVNVDNQPPYTEGYSFKDYMNLIPNFKDPFESNVVEHDGVLVIRDDLIPQNLGSKARYAEALMQQVKEKYILYGMVKSGQALKVLAATAKKYNKIVVGIACLYKEPPIAHIEAMEHGAILMYYQSGGMAGVRKRCRAFINDQLLGRGLYIPAGVKSPYITAGFAKSINNIYQQYKPDAIFCATSTAVMAHGIMSGTPEKCEVHAVQVAGNASLKKWPGRAIVYEHDQPFSEAVDKKDAPPFNCIPTYDAKAWKYARDYKKNNPNKTVMFLNVAGQHDLKDVK